MDMKTAFSFLERAFCVRKYVATREQNVKHTLTRLLLLRGGEVGTVEERVDGGVNSVGQLVVPREAPLGERPRGRPVRLRWDARRQLQQAIQQKSAAA